MSNFSVNKLIDWQDTDSIDPNLEQIVGKDNFQHPWFLRKGLEMSKAICMIPTKGTAFLIAKDLIMTNWHIFRREYWANNTKAIFDYEEGEDGLPSQYSTQKFAPEKFFYSDSELDFALVGLENSVTDRVPINITKHVQIEGHTRVNIIQHPGAGFKKIAIRENGIKYHDEKILQYWTDTEHGSSGAPLFNDKWEIIGLHYKQDSTINENTKIYYNEGHTMASIVNKINTLFPSLLPV